MAYRSGAVTTRGCGLGSDWLHSLHHWLYWLKPNRPLSAGCTFCDECCSGTGRTPTPGSKFQVLGPGACNWAKSTSPWSNGTISRSLSTSFIDLSKRLSIILKLWRLLSMLMSAIASCSLVTGTTCGHGCQDEGTKPHWLESHPSSSQCGFGNRLQQQAPLSALAARPSHLRDSGSAMDCKPFTPWVGKLASEQHYVHLPMPNADTDAARRGELSFQILDAA